MQLDLTDLFFASLLALVASLCIAVMSEAAGGSLFVESLAVIPVVSWGIVASKVSR